MTKHLHTLLLFVSLLLMIVTFSACSVFSSTEEEEDLIELKLLLKAGDNINPSQVSKRNPVVVNLYQLKNIDAFKSSQILDLYEKDIAILADDLVNKKILGSVLPQEKRAVTLAIAQGTKYLAVFVQFSNYSQAKAKAWLELKEIDDIEQINISIDSLTVNIEPVIEQSFWSW
ncbi:MAG: type VI secretion system lipoprotein TssJ [Colwellia sp.]|nr:type VI secretion system lipoprotein TssJ [Colwellia sp.]